MLNLQGCCGVLKSRTPHILYTRVSSSIRLSRLPCHPETSARETSSLGATKDAPCNFCHEGQTRGPYGTKPAGTGAEDIKASCRHASISFPTQPPKKKHLRATHPSVPANYFISSASTSIPQTTGRGTDLHLS